MHVYKSIIATNMRYFHLHLYLHKLFSPDVQSINVYLHILRVKNLNWMSGIPRKNSEWNICLFMICLQILANTVDTLPYV